MAIFQKKFSFLRRDRKGQPSDRRGKGSHLSNTGDAVHFPVVVMAPRLLALAAAGLLSCSLVALAGKTAQKSQPVESSSWASLIAEASQRFGVPAHWIRAVMQAESAGDKGALSPKGAMGLMQIMPETYAELRLRHHLGADPYAPRNNILAGAAYLREMRDLYGRGGFLAAYNAGPGRYEDYLNRGRPLPQETRAYVAAIAAKIDVPGIPRHSEGASTASQMAISGAPRESREQAKAPGKGRFTTAISQFDDRKNGRRLSLFAIIKSVFEPASAAAKTVDMTALEPVPDRAFNATLSAAESLRNHPTNTLRSSLIPSGDALFAGPSTRTGK